MPKRSGAERSGASHGQSRPMMDTARYRVYERGPNQQRVAKLRFHATHAATQRRPRGSSWSRQGDVTAARARTLPQACRRRQDQDPQIAAHAHNHRAVCGRSLAVCRAVGRLMYVDSKSSAQAPGEAIRDRMAIGFEGAVIEHMFAQSEPSRLRRQVGAGASPHVGSAASPGGVSSASTQTHECRDLRRLPTHSVWIVGEWRLAVCLPEPGDHVVLVGLRREPSTNEAPGHE